MDGTRLEITQLLADRDLLLAVELIVKGPYPLQLWLGDLSSGHFCWSLAFLFRPRETGTSSCCFSFQLRDLFKLADKYRDCIRRGIQLRPVLEGENFSLL